MKKFEGVQADILKADKKNQLVSAGALTAPKTVLKDVNGVDQFNCIYVLYDNDKLFSAGPYPKCDVTIGGEKLDLSGGDQTMYMYRQALASQSTIPPIVQANGVTMMVYPVGNSYQFKQLDFANGGAIKDPSANDLATFFSAKYISFVLNCAVGVTLELF